MPDNKPKERGLRGLNADYAVRLRALQRGQRGQMEDLEIDGLTGLIIAAAQRVHSSLAPGFLEKVYENALVVELTSRGVPLCVNYLRALDRRICLLVNFGRPSLQVRRVVNRY